jgi:hypothetical protein
MILVVGKKDADLLLKKTKGMVIGHIERCKATNKSKVEY